MKALKVSLITGLITSALFGLGSLLFYFGDWTRLIVIASLGLFVGFVAAPEFEPEAFDHAWVLQLTAGLVAGALVSVIFGLSFGQGSAAIFIGGFIGVTASSWVKHLSLP